MASGFKQAERPLSVNTPLGKDVLLLVGFHGKDGISELFRYQLEMVAENKKDVAFDKLLGQKVTVTLLWGRNRDKKRFFNGICSRVSQGRRDSVFTSYGMEIVPQAWMLSRKAQSRIFQRLSVPDILKKVLVGFDVSFEIQGTFEPRDYCVQYRETDFNFASRLMEEEGIYYFFKHEDGSHTMVVANTPQSHPDVPVQSEVIFEKVVGGERDELRITDWEKEQVLRSGKYTLWDHTFELSDKHAPGKNEPHLEAKKEIQGSVTAGTVTHQLKVGGNDKLEIYDFPGEYAQRFDGVDKGGGDQSSELQKIFKDNERTVGIRMQQEALPSLEIEGESNCRQFTSGHRFTLKRHFNADGQYVITTAEHEVTTSTADFLAGQGETTYRNTFTCVPVALPYRPPRVTPKPVVQGSQTAVVVGPSGEEIFTDKFGRVKVQFHWDRDGKNDVESSCWIRVATAWAGKQWGVIHIPRIGQEVVVDFLEGDPDQPIIVGSVYNAEMMPPYKLPDFKTVSTKRSRSTIGGDPKTFNELRFEDKKGKEQVFIHSQKRMDVRVRGSLFETVHANRNEIIGLKGGTETGGHLAISVGGDHDLLIGGGLFEGIGKALNLSVKSDVVNDFQATEATIVGGKFELNARQIVIEALSKISLKVGGSFVVIDLTGVTISGPMVKINSGGAGDSTGDPSIEDAAGAEESDTGEPGFLDRPRPAGGGGGRRKRTLHSQHGPNVTRNADGSYQVGSIKVVGNDNYAQAVLSDIAVIGTTPQGKALLKNLDSSGKSTTIQQPGTPFSPPNAVAWPGSPTSPNFQDATPAGQPVFDGAGNPVNDSAGNQLLGTGKGVDSTVEYDPTQWPDPSSRTKAPGDVILFHELQHSNNEERGQYDGTPRTDNFDTNEEFNAIGPENKYRDERNPQVPRRNDHHDL
jgi:type VI secretion system secreted protein VgrG